MTPARLRLLLALASLSLLAACGPPWRVIRESGPPSALTGVTQIGLAFDFSRTTVDGVPEQMHLAQLPPNEQQDWMEARNAFMGTYMAELTRQLSGVVQIVPSTGAEPVQLIVQPYDIQRGYWRMVVAQETRIDLGMSFVVGGQPTDEISARAVQQASMRNASVVNRMNDCAVRLARITAQFIRRAQQGGG